MKSYAKFINFHSRKCIWKLSLENGGHLSRPQCVKENLIAFLLKWSFFPKIQLPVPKGPIVHKSSLVQMLFNTLMSNKHHGTSDHWQLKCLFNSLFRPKSKEIIKAYCLVVHAGNLTVDSLHKGTVMRKHFAAIMSSSFLIYHTTWTG